MTPRPGNSEKPTSGDDPARDSAGRNASRQPNAVGPIILLSVLAIGPLAWYGAPAEIARWYTASAVERYVNDDLAGATMRLEQALQWQPDSPEAYRTRAEWRLRDGDFAAALVDAERATAGRKESVGEFVLRGEILQHLGRHREAISGWETIVAQHQDAPRRQRASLLNALAYARAVGNTDLDQALEEIDKALELQADNLDRSAMLDTRGFIYYLQADYPAAKRDLDAALATSEPILTLEERRKDYTDPRDREGELETWRRSVAVMRYHRQLVHQAIEQDEAAEDDRQRVVELGFEPDEHLF